MRRPRTFPFLAPGRAPLPALPGSEAATGAGIPMLDETALPAYVAPAGGWSLIWRRLRRDRLALISGCYLVFVLGMCFIAAPIASWLLGHGPNDPYIRGADLARKPVGPWTHVPVVYSAYGAVPPHAHRTLFILGGDGPLGRDEFLRLLYGGQVSLEVAFGATVIAMTLGLVLGLSAGYFRGWTDAVVSRTTEFTMAFPVLLLLIALGTTISDRFDFITIHGLFNRGVLSLAAVIGLITWFYPARIIRAEVLRLREQEFVEAARMIGASNWRIMRKHLLPHLVAPLIVYSTLTFATIVVLEAAISFLGIGIRLPTASWGNMLSTNWGTLLNLGDIRQAVGFEWKTTNWTTITPVVAVASTVLALAALGEGLRRAFDPRSPL
jgi:ABC-type dipeptide/oligopeptide/nickel transport system permease subunit